MQELFNVGEILRILREDLALPSAKALRLSDFRPNSEFGELLRTLVPREESLGRGAMGTAYSISETKLRLASLVAKGEARLSEIEPYWRARKRKDQEFVIKSLLPCKDREEGLNRIFCDRIDEQEPFKSPYGRKWRITMPAQLVEGVIGAHLNQLRSMTPHFIEILGVYQIDQSMFERDRGSYIIMEKAVPLFKETLGGTKSDIVRSSKHVYLWLFQTVHAIYVAQRELKFMHNDLHIGNFTAITTEKGSKKATYAFRVNSSFPGQQGERNDLFTINDMDFEIKIIDYGLGRLETNDYVVNSSHDYVVPYFHGVFNPVYDILFLLGWGMLPLLTLKNRNKLVFSMKRHAELLSVCLGIEIHVNDLNSSERDIEIYTERLSHFQATPRTDLDWINTRVAEKFSYRRILHYLAAKYNNPNQETLPPRELKSLPNLLSIHTEFTRPQGWGKGTSGGSLGFQPQRDAPDWFNYRDETLGGIYYHVAKIDLKKAVGEGYGLASVCCKVDETEYLLDHKGVVINGGFFNIRSYSNKDGNYSPVGHFYNTIKTPNNVLSFGENERDVSLDKYRGLLGLVVIERDRIRILNTKTVVFEDLQKEGVDYFQSGPLLIYENKELILDDLEWTDQDLKEEKLETRYARKTYSDHVPTYLFQCEERLWEKEEGEEEAMDDTYHTFFMKNGVFVRNCATIPPGELTHGANRNPRSMLIIGKDNSVILVVVDQRNAPVRTNQELRGATFKDLQKIAKRWGARHALNLDGGFSSNMAWRFSDKQIWTTSHAQNYPVGNLLALTKSSGV